MPRRRQIDRRALADAERARDVLAWRLLSARPDEDTADLLALLRAAEERVVKLTFEGMARR